MSLSVHLRGIAPAAFAVRLTEISDVTRSNASTLGHSTPERGVG